MIHSKPQPSRLFGGHRSFRAGMSLLEIVLMVMIISAASLTGLAYSRSHGDTAMERACIANRTSLQAEAELFQQENGRLPSRNLQELSDADYIGGELPKCPHHSQDLPTNYSLRRGVVVCGYHPE